MHIAPVAVPVYVGTFSKVLFPENRLGYLAVPETQVERFEKIAEMFAAGSPEISQAIVASFIADGHFARHIQRMRKLYAERHANLRIGFSNPTQLCSSSHVRSTCPPTRSAWMVALFPMSSDS